VLLLHDELEALRLCDGEGLTQEEAGERMGVSRGTVQRLVASGRRKVITAIVAGRALVMEGEM
jgi:excisionase family DNA binding protein